MFGTCDECFWIEFGVISLSVILVMTVIALIMRCCLKDGENTYVEVHDVMSQHIFIIVHAFTG